MTLKNKTIERMQTSTVKFWYCDICNTEIEDGGWNYKPLDWACIAGGKNNERLDMCSHCTARALQLITELRNAP